MLFIYRNLINILFPIILIIILIRIFLKKEDRIRFKEKLFISSLKIKKDTKKKLIWFHAASIGELKSIIPLIKRLNKDNKYQFLVTTVTLSSAQLIIKDLFGEKNIIHRFFPLDKSNLIEAFLSGWSPCLIIFIDSEIWPNFITKIKEKKIPLVLLNGRITKKTFKKWKMISSISKKIFQSFTLCLASSEESKKYLQELKAIDVKFIGNLKLTSENKVNNLHSSDKDILSKNKFWCAISTHKGEDEFCLKTHLLLKKKFKNIISVIIPRHIDRSKKIKVICQKLNLNSQILSDGDLINPDKEIIIINSYGIISNYLHLCGSVFIGKSLLKKLEPVSGQNPIEAAKLGCKVYHGPYVNNFREIYNLFHEYKIAETIFNEKELAVKLFHDFNVENKIKNEKIKTINILGDGILDKTSEELKKINI